MQSLAPDAGKVSGLLTNGMNIGTLLIPSARPCRRDASSSLKAMPTVPRRGRIHFSVKILFAVKICIVATAVIAVGAV
jgi:hypothetical protein